MPAVFFFGGDEILERDRSEGGQLGVGLFDPRQIGGGQAPERAMGGAYRHRPAAAVAGAAHGELYALGDDLMFRQSAVQCQPAGRRHRPRVGRAVEPGVPVGEATIAYQHDSADFIPEGIAAGPDGELYLGSIRHGDIVRIADDTRRLIAASDGPHWSVFGMRLAEDGLLWFVSSAIPEFAELEEADAGKTGLYALDTRTGDIVVRAVVPDTGNKQVLGDLVLDGDDTIYLADQADGIIYWYSIKSNEFSTLVDRGQLVSPQGLVFDESGSSLYVADYVAGLYRVSLSTGNVERVTPHESTNDYGIDGLYRYKNKLVAIQNGIRPNRVVEFQLSADGSVVIASKILAMNLPEFNDPNLGEIVGDSFLFIANSHWPKFDRDGNLPEDLTGPIVLKIDLSD